MYHLHKSLAWLKFVVRLKKISIQSMNYKKEVIIRGIKIIDIGFITTIYSLLGIFLAKVCDKVNGPFDKKKEDRKPTWQILFEVILYFWFIGIVFYVVRNIVPLIPFPLEGVYGFKHERVKELINATMFVITFLYFQRYYQNKVQYLLNRLSDSESEIDSSIYAA